MEPLYIIPARGGSKGLPGKNSKLLNGKPLIHYSIEIALSLSRPEHVCVTTDDPLIKDVSEQAGVEVPFLRPDKYASDTASMQDVLLHAINYYESLGIYYTQIVLLQPTSPFREITDIKKALSLYDKDVDMVMSVFETRANPYYVLFEETLGFLTKSKEGNFATRQSAPVVYQANGSIYIINVQSLKEKSMKKFDRIRKVVMDEIKSVDIDTQLDWDYCEFLLSRGDHTINK